MKVAKWGNSLAVRLPSAVADAMQLREGDELVFNVSQTGDVRVEKTGDRQAWIESLRRFEGRMPAGVRFDRDDANRRG